MSRTRFGTVTLFTCENVTDVRHTCVHTNGCDHPGHGAPTHIANSTERLQKGVVDADDEKIDLFGDGGKDRTI